MKIKLIILLSTISILAGTGCPFQKNAQPPTCGLKGGNYHVVGEKTRTMELKIIKGKPDTWELVGKSDKKKTFSGSGEFHNASDKECLVTMLIGDITFKDEKKCVHQIQLIGYNDWDDLFVNIVSQHKDKCKTPHKGGMKILTHNGQVHYESDQ